MKAVIELDVPEWQIGQEVSVYFPDTMCKKGRCKPFELVRCSDCLFGESCKNGRGEHGIMCYNSQSANKDWIHEPDWFCADGERKD